MGKSTPEERIEQLKTIMRDEELEHKDRLRYFYHAVLLEYGFFRRRRNDRFIKKHGTKLNETIDIVMFVKTLDGL